MKALFYPLKTLALKTKERAQTQAYTIAHKTKPKPKPKTHARTKIIARAKLHIATLLFLLASTNAQALELYETETSARALAMGNSYVSIVRDSDAIFYNPAGLAFEQGVYLTLADPRAGLNGADSLASITQFQNTADFSTALANLDGSRIWAGGGGKVALRVPFVAFAAYNNIDASLAIDIASGPMVAKYTNDTVYALAFAANILPFTYFGITAKQIKRVGDFEDYTAGEVATLTYSQFESDVLTPAGTALGFDVGLTFAIDTVVAPAISIVGRNIGGLSFDASTSNPAPADQEEEWIVGASLVTDAGFVSISPSIDVKHATNSDIDFDRKTHIGVEISLPLIDLRAGLHQRYWSAGVGLGLGPLQLDIASWGVDVGTNDSAIEDRRYMAQIAIEFGLGLDIFGAKSSSHRGKGKGSNLRKNRARRRIKVRR